MKNYTSYESVVSEFPGAVQENKFQHFWELVGNTPMLEIIYRYKKDCREILSIMLQLLYVLILTHYRVPRLLFLILLISSCLILIILIMEFYYSRLVRRR